MKRVNNYVQLKKQDFPTYVNAFLPEDSLVPLSYSASSAYEVLAKEGDRISEGQLIAREADGTEVHAPLPGIIKSIGTCTLPDGSFVKAADIHLDGSFSFLGKKSLGREWKSFSPSAILEKFKTCGIINTFSKSEPLYAQIKNCTIKENRFLAVRLFDDDPSLCTDSFISHKFKNQTLQGAVAIAKAMNAAGIIFAVSKKAADDFDLKGVEVPHDLCIIDDSKYPAGKAGHIVKAVRNMTSYNGVDFSHINQRSIFVDSLTALRAYNCIEYEKPVMEQFVQVAGDCLNASAMFKVRIGTTVRDLVKHCGGFSKKPSKIIVNGLINGYEINSMDMPVTKTVKSIIFLTRAQLHSQSRTVCIRCGRCRRICPEGLKPDLIYAYPENKFICETSVLCTDCNLCNSVCPSRISLSQTISLLRTQYESLHV